MADYRNIRAKARDIRAKVMDENSVSTTPVVLAARQVGYAVNEFQPTADTANVSGAVNHKTKTIHINATEVPHRKRFTIAHEIGHVVLHPNEDEVDFRGDVNYSVEKRGKESEANAFAAELLMPRHVFESLWYAYSGDIEEVARQLGVSTQAAEIRASKFRLSNS